MNALERVAHTLGRIRGQARKGYDQVFGGGWTNPSVADPTAWSGSPYWGIGAGKSRKPVSKADFIAAFQSWVYVCVKLNAQTCASVPLRLYVAKKSKDQKFRTARTKAVHREQRDRLFSCAGYAGWLRKAEDVEEVVEHPFLDLMESVNPWQNRRDLWEMTIMFLDLTGEAYWYLPKAKLGIPSEIFLLPSQNMAPVFGDSLKNAISGYRFTRGKDEVLLKDDEVVYFTYPNPSNTFTGFSTVRGIAAAVYLQQQMDEFETHLFENRARVGGVIVQKERMSADARSRLKEQMSQQHSGPRNAGKLLMLPYGLDYTPDTMTPQELNFIDGRKFNRTEIMAAFDVPEGAVISENVNRSNAESADYRHAKNGIAPRLRRVEEKLNERLIPRYGANLFCAFDDPVPEDQALRLKGRLDGVAGSVMTINEARADAGAEAVEGGDEVFVPMGWVPLSRKMKGGDAAPPPMPPGIAPPETEPEDEPEDELEEKVVKRVREMLAAK